MGENLAIFGGKPIRGERNPLPTVHPRIIAPEAYHLVKRALDKKLRGNENELLEEKMAKLSGQKYGITVANCTAAIHTALAALDIGPGDEVITNPISDYGSVGGILAQNALPVFADVDLRNGNLTAETISKVITPRTKAIVLVHWWGLMSEIGPIVELANKKIYH